MRSELSGAPERRGVPAHWLGLVLALVVMLVSAPGLSSAEEQEDSSESHAAADEHEATGEEHEAAGEEHGEEHAEGGEAHEGGEEHHFHKNHFAVMIGSTQSVEIHGEEHHDEGHGDPHSEVTSSGGRDDPDFTLGIDYERRLTKLFGIAGLLDFVVEGQREFLFGPLAVLHPFRGAKLWVGPLYEVVREGENEWVARVGAGWDFKVGKVTLTPAANYDITNEHEIWVLGLTIGKGW